MQKINYVAKSDNVELLKAALSTIHSFDTRKILTDSSKWNENYHYMHSKAANKSSMLRDYLHFYCEKGATGSQVLTNVQFHNHSGSATGRNIFDLPKDWDAFLTACKKVLEAPAFNVGDWVTVKSERFDGGHAHKVKVGDTYQIKEIQDSGINESGKWANGAEGRFCCFSMLRPATEAEILAVSEIKIAGHVAEVKEAGTITFGCQSFSRAEILAYRRLITSPVNGTITFHGTIITIDILDKLLAKISR
jgi:hypothetical protein